MGLEGAKWLANSCALNLGSMFGKSTLVVHLHWLDVFKKGGLNESCCC